jgi:integrase
MTADGVNLRSARSYSNGAFQMALRSIRPVDTSPFQWVFHGRVPKMKTFQKDLSKAGIVVVDESGRRMDFHALRGTFCTMLAVNQVPLADAMHLMRHSDPKLTMKIYTDASQLELGNSMAKLPAITLRAI